MQSMTANAITLITVPPSFSTAAIYLKSKT